MSAKGRARGRATDEGTAPLFELEPGVELMESDAAAPKPDHGEEFYPTPEGAILPLLESPLVTLPPGVWIEPCAGTGAIVKCVNRTRSDVRWRLFELDERVGRYLTPLVRPGLDKLAPFGDFVTRPWPATWSRADVLIMNPPFTHALAFVRAALERAHNVLMLQRSNWFGTQARAPWLRQHAPFQLTIEERPSFTLDGKTDSCEFSWFAWLAGQHNERVGRLAMLDAPRGNQLALM